MHTLQVSGAHFGGRFWRFTVSLMARVAFPEVSENEAMEVAPAAPRPPPDAFCRPSLPSSAPDADSIHVLAVDDNFIDRKVIEKLLRNASYRVTSVDSGSKALEVLGVGEDQDAVNVHDVNMVVTDYCMPGMSGYDLLKRVREIPALKDIPVVIVSSENVPSRIKRCLDEGAQKFILKPMQMADVKLFKTYVCRQKQVSDEPSGVPCNKRKYGSEVCQAAQSPERRPRLSGLTAA